MNPQSLETNPFAHLLNPYTDETTQPPTQGLETTQPPTQGLETIQAWLATQPPHTRLEILHTLTQTTLPSLETADKDTLLDTLRLVNAIKKHITDAYNQGRTTAWKLLGGASKGTTPNGTKYTFTKPRPTIKREVKWDLFRLEYPDIYDEWVTEKVMVPTIGTLRMS